MFVILSVMWAIEFATNKNFSNEADIVADLIKIISAAIIAHSLLAIPIVKSYFFEKYILMRTNSEEVNRELVA